jgi:hypothetical protein
MGIKGLWFAKLVLEFYILTAYYMLIKCSNWEKIAQESDERQQKDKQMIQGEK